MDNILPPPNPVFLNSQLTFEKSVHESSSNKTHSLFCNFCLASIPLSSYSSTQTVTSHPFCHHFEGMASRSDSPNPSPQASPQLEVPGWRILHREPSERTCAGDASSRAIKLDRVRFGSFSAPLPVNFCHLFKSQDRCDG